MTADNELHQWIAELSEAVNARDDAATDGRYELAGWRVASFAADRLEYAEKSAVTTTTLWNEYLAWCRTSAQQPMVPLSMGDFYQAMDEIAVAAGLGRRQRGGHILYDGVAVKPMKATS
jgi:hypothetical protein